MHAGPNRFALEFASAMIALLLNKKYWFIHFCLVAIVSALGLIWMGERTYVGAPPVATYVDEDARVVITAEQIKAGQQIFQLRGLMHYGSFWGDGAGRGPDFSAQTLHLVVRSMQTYYADRLQAQRGALTEDDQAAIAARVRREVHINRWHESTGTITLTPAQVAAFDDVVVHCTRMFTDPDYPEAFRPTGYIDDPQELRNLAAFMYWGAWAAAADRPGTDYSYTQNWPYDPDAGNYPTKDVYLWSFVSIGVLLLGIVAVLYLYGQMKAGGDDPFGASLRTTLLMTTPDLENGMVRRTQRLTYRFYVLAAVAFGLQVVAGLLSALDFADPLHAMFAGVLPFPILRGYHTFLQIYWMFMCWVGYTIFFLPRLAPVPKAQAALIKLLFWLCLVVGLGGIVGIRAAYEGLLSGALAYWFGSQGWEFMELGRFFQYLLLGAFSLWIFIIYRGIRPWVARRTFWSIPAWLLWGSDIMVFFLFFGLFATPGSNWAIADFWRWMVVHMWVEVTFEVFTTVIVAYILVQLGMISKPMAERVVYLAVILFLATATLGVAHNFYWIAKPTEVIALGSVFSTLQVLPLLLLTLDAWRVRREGAGGWSRVDAGRQKFVMEGVWLFVLAVNFWNVFAAGVLGSLMNLPIINYFEHATYITNNHAHGAMFGVKGNIALAGVLFCSQHLIGSDHWNARLIKASFWTMNIGLALMMLLALFPIGMYQLWIVLDQGYWAARTQAVIAGDVFGAFVNLRGIGATLFTIGAAMMVWFIVSRARHLRGDADARDDDWSLRLARRRSVSAR